jgi:hypothetical protein
MLLHFSIIRLSLGSLHCACLKLYIKIISKLRRYTNVVMWQHVVQLHVRSLASRLGCSLPLGKTRYPLYRRLVGPQGRSGQARKIFRTCPDANLIANFWKLVTRRRSFLSPKCKKISCFISI